MAANSWLCPIPQGSCQSPQVPEDLSHPCLKSLAWLPSSTGTKASSPLRVLLHQRWSSSPALWHRSRPTHSSLSEALADVPLTGSGRMCHLPPAKIAQPQYLLTRSAPLLSGFALSFLLKRPIPWVRVCGSEVEHFSGTRRPWLPSPAWKGGRRGGREEGDRDGRWKGRKGRKWGREINNEAQQGSATYTPQPRLFL